VENAVAAGELVTRLLEFARAGEDRMEAERLPAAAAVLRPVVNRFQPLAQERGLYLRLEAPADAEVWVDRQQFERVVSNLVDNTIKFTERGGVTVELIPPVRLPGQEPGGGGVRVRVRDTGIGIPSHSAGHVFDEFYQVNNHERDRKKGFGIGLAICRSLARQFGGDIRLIDTSPTGSCFEVLVPAAAAPRSGGSGSSAASAGGNGTFDPGGRSDDAVAGVVEAGNDAPPPPRERPGGGGRPDRPPGDLVDPEAAGVCRI
jgi:signal transduction histidine kinase